MKYGNTNPYKGANPYKGRQNWHAYRRWLRKEYGDVADRFPIKSKVELGPECFCEDCTDKLSDGPFFISGYTREWGTGKTSVQVCPVKYWSVSDEEMVRRTFPIPPENLHRVKLVAIYDPDL